MWCCLAFTRPEEVAEGEQTAGKGDAQHRLWFEGLGDEYGRGARDETGLGEG